MSVSALVIIGIAVILCVIAFEAGRIGWYLTLSKRLTGSIQRFEHIDPNATKRVLIIGDSTGYGTGTSDAVFSIAGRIATEFPDIELENRSKTGLKLHALLRMLKQANKDFSPDHFDLVVILCGGMNVVHYTPLSRMRRLLQKCLQEANVLGKEVLLVIPHNPALPPMFRFPVSFLNGMRGKQAEKVFIEVADAERVHRASLFGKASDLIYEKDLYARDKVHPNDEGYGIWYAEMRPVLKEILTG